MRVSQSLRRAAVAAIMVAAACHDGTSPTPPAVPFDAPRARARVEPLAAIFDQPIFASFEASLSFFEPYFRSDLATSLEVAAPGVADLSSRFGLRVTRALSPFTRLSATSIPDSVKGKTFVYDVPSQSYVIDPAATGLPAGEVRFVLYAWEPGTGRPSTPLTRIGRVDLADVSDGGDGPQLVEVFVARESPFLGAADFVVMHDAANGVNAFGIEGSATDGFTVGIVDLTGTESGAAGQHHLTYTTTLSTSPLDVSEVEQLTSDQATASQGGRLALMYDGHTFSDESVGNGTELKFDGSLYARVLFPSTPQDVTRYLRPDGSPLPTTEVTNLNALLERVLVANFFWINLAWP
jgi:hypothetical protein